MLPVFGWLAPVICASGFAVPPPRPKSSMPPFVKCDTLPNWFSGLAKGDGPGSVGIGCCCWSPIREIAWRGLFDGGWSGRELVWDVARCVALAHAA